MTLPEKALGIVSLLHMIEMILEVDLVLFCL